MTARPIVRGRAVVLGGMVALTMALATPAALASMDDELALARQIVEENVLALDAARSTAEKRRVLHLAIEAMDVIDAAAGRDESVWGDARAALRAQAIDGDQLRMTLIDALLDAARGGDAEAGFEAKSTLLLVRDPAYRAAGWSALARWQSDLGHQDEAERLVSRATEDAARIDRRQTRDGALRAAVLSLRPAKTRPPVVETATDAMSDADARNRTYAALARAERSAAKLSEKGDDLRREARAALDAGRMLDALYLAQALESRDETRAGIVGAVLDHALAKLDDRLAMEAAKSTVGNKPQDEALRAIVNAHIDRERPMRALHIVPLFVNANARVAALGEVSQALADQGYETAAIEALNSVDPATLDAAALARLSIAFADRGVFDKARSVAGALPVGEARSFAFSRISKRLSDAGDVTAAEGLLAEISAPDDLSFARSGLAKALAGKADIAGAMAFEPGLTEAEHRDRLFEAVALAHIREKAVQPAREALARVESPVASANVHVALAMHLASSDFEAALTELEVALANLSAMPSKRKAGPGFATVATTLAELGEFGRADAVLAAMEEGAARQKAAAAIAEIELRQGRLQSAGKRAEALVPGARDDIRGELAWRAFEKDRDAARLVGAVQDVSWRTRVPILRRMAESHALELDEAGLFADPRRSVATLVESGPREPTTADFILGTHRLQAPARTASALQDLHVPDVLSLTAATLRAGTPAPRDGRAQVAILGFSPFGLEAFKLTSTGNAAIHQVQVSQNLTWPHYIAIESGVVTLGELLRTLPQTTKLRFLEPSGDKLLIRAPIIVLPGATLLLSGAEFGEYRLSADSGSFIAVAGTLRIQDTALVGYDESKDAPAYATEKTKAVFRPFITAWGGSDLRIGGSLLAMLGYDSGKAYGLTQSSGAAVQSLYNLGSESPTGQIVDNSFDNLRYGYYSYEAEHVDLVGNEYRDNVVYGIDPHDRSRHLVIALNTSYGAAKKHGIIVSREVDDSFIVGNTSLLNEGSGLMLDRLSQRNLIYANTALRNGGDGLTFYESGCNFAAANRLDDNRRAGIKIRNSTNVVLHANGMTRNQQSGVDIYVADLRNSPEGQSRNFVLDPYEPVSTAAVAANTFQANGSAINVNGAASVVIDRNRFHDQRNRIFNGDLRPLSSYLLQLGNQTAVGVSMTCPRQPEHGHACTFGSIETQAGDDVSCKVHPTRNATVTEKTNG